jgi:hypothetical protein
VTHNWVGRLKPDRWPSMKNWELRITKKFTKHPTQRLEK